MGADGRLFVLYDYENGRICQFSLHRSRTSCPFQDSLPGARVQRAQLFARVKGGSLAQWM